MAVAAVKQTNQKALKENERKWGLPLLQAGWSLLPSTILTKQQELGLSPIDVNILLHIVSYWWYADRLPYPSKARLARCIGVDKSTIQRHIRAMEQRGLIRRIERKNEFRGQTSNQYDLNGLIARATDLAKEELAKKQLQRDENSLKVIGAEEDE